MKNQEVLREILRIEQLYIRGSGYYELENFNLLIGAGQLVFLCEPDGLGGNALADVFLGRQSVFSGKLFLEGKPIIPQKELSYEKEGIYVISEDESMQPYMSVEENLFLSWKPYLFSPWFRKRSLRAMAGQILKKLDISISPGTLVRRLSFEDRQLLKFARAYCKGARLIVINGVMDVISEARQYQLMELVEKMRRENIAVLCISQKVPELSVLGDMLVLMKNGTKLWTMLQPEINIQQAARIYNSKITAFERMAPSGRGGLFLEIYRNGQSVFSARSGRCIGIYGQERRMLEAFVTLFTGKSQMPEMEMRVLGKAFWPQSYKDCVRSGICKVDIQFLENNFSNNLSLAENLYLTDMKKMRTKGFLKNVRYEKFLQNEYHFSHNGMKEFPAAGQELWDMLFLRLIHSSMKMIIFAGPLPANFTQVNGDYLQKLLERDKIPVFLSVNEQELKRFCHDVYDSEYILP